MQRDLLERRRGQDDAGHDRRMRPRVHVPHVAAALGVARELLAAMLERRPWSGEVPPPEQPGEDTGCHQRDDRAAGKSLTPLERPNHWEPDGDDDLTQSDDHDQAVALGEVTTPHDP